MIFSPLYFPYAVFTRIKCFHDQCRNIDRKIHNLPKAYFSWCFFKDSKNIHKAGTIFIFFCIQDNIPTGFFTILKRFLTRKFCSILASRNNLFYGSTRNICMFKACWLQSSLAIFGNELSFFLSFMQKLNPYVDHRSD